MNKKLKNQKFDLKITQNADLWKYLALDKIIKYKWGQSKANLFMLGRFQPWHLGHRNYLRKFSLYMAKLIFKSKMFRSLGDNPYTYNQVKNISDNLIDFKNRILITKAPNICEINYGRTVGYK